jgi:hypothetical protein
MSFVGPAVPSAPNGVALEEIVLPSGDQVGR